jgi:cardiolipin synthase A/B
MYHVKVITVDALRTSVGSTNFDTPPFSINDEANLNVHDCAFAQEFDVFEGDLKHSRRIALEEWDLDLG